MLGLDWRQLEGASALFDLCDCGLFLGDSVFDTALALNSARVVAGQHIDRLSDSCATLGIHYDRAAMEATLTRAAAALGTGALRTLTRGRGTHALLPGGQCSSAEAAIAKSASIPK